MNYRLSMATFEIKLLRLVKCNKKPMPYIEIYINVLVNCQKPNFLKIIVSNRKTVVLSLAKLVELLDYTTLTFISYFQKLLHMFLKYEINVKQTLNI